MVWIFGISLRKGLLLRAFLRLAEDAWKSNNLVSNMFGFMVMNPMVQFVKTITLLHSKLHTP